MAQLVVEFPDGRQQRFSLDHDELMLGREPSCDVCIPDPKVSRRHARILRSAAGYTIEDLGSINGYLLDGRTVHGRSPLRHGSRIGLGDARLRFEDEEGRGGREDPAAAPAAAAARGSRRGAVGGLTLRVVEGELVGQSFVLGGKKAVVGRSGEADVVLDDPSISRRHATLLVDGDQVDVRDLGSSNGTFVDGRQVQQVRLRPGQSVRFGSLLLRLDAPEARAEPPRPELSQGSRDVADQMRARLPQLERPERAARANVAAAEQAHEAIDRAAAQGPAPGSGRATPAATPGPATASAPSRRAQRAARASGALTGAAAALGRRASHAFLGRPSALPWRGVAAALTVVCVLGLATRSRQRLRQLATGRGGAGALSDALLGHGPSDEELVWRQRLEHRLSAAAAKLRADEFAEAAELYGQALLEEPIEPRALWGRRLSVARLGQREDLTGGRRELEVGHPFEAMVAASSGLRRGLVADGPPLPTLGRRAQDADPELLGDNDAPLHGAVAPEGKEGEVDAAVAPRPPVSPPPSPAPAGAVAPAPGSVDHPRADAPLPEDPLLHQALQNLADQGGLQVAQACGERAQAACASESYAACLAQTACLAAFDPSGELGPALRALAAQAVGSEPADGPAAAALAAAYPQPTLRRAMLIYAAGSYAAAAKALRNIDTPRSRALQADVAQVTDLLERGNKEEHAGQAAQALGTFEQAETVERRLLPREVPSAPRQELSRRAQRIFLRQGDDARARGALAEALASYQRAQSLGSDYPPVVRAIGGLHARAQKLLLRAGTGAQAAERKDGKTDPCAPFQEAMAACAPDDPVHQQAKEELAACARKRGRVKKTAAAAIDG